MNVIRTFSMLVIAALTFFSAAFASTGHPALILTAGGVEQLRAAKSSYPPLLDKTIKEATLRVERSIAEGIIVPIPKDPGGGYTHERHKENYKIIQDAGVLYQLTGEKRYLQQATGMLIAYADMYPNLPLHPEQKSQSPGKLFWQGLNEAVWLVYSIQGYDAIVDALSDQDRRKIETDLLRPMADFLSIESERTFRLIHNHGTWSAAAVGMTGYALRDQSLVKRALLGLDGDGSSGFLAQLDQLFSPDGYYTEGPYYQRYAMAPFVVFAQSIENNEPERKIFKHRDGVLLKAIDATIQQTYANKFFPINDAIKEKGLDTWELVYAVATAYSLTKRNDYLSVAEFQGQTIISGPGLAVAKAVANGDARPFQFRSMLLSDGPAGDQGGLAIMRMGKRPLAETLVVKNTSQGMGHGHFDKLSYLLYDNGQEILTDYGAARFLNVPTKDGGRYLPENESWAKQTVAHNTLVVDEATQFGGDWRRSQKYWPTIVHFGSGEALNIVSAETEDAYPGTKIVRTFLQITDEAFAAPIVVDLVRATSKSPVRYDLPLYFDGQVVDFDEGLKINVADRAPLGDKNGYQHLWVEAEGRLNPARPAVSWLNAGRFYTLHSVSPDQTDIVFVRTGANDPQFNLRSEQGVILRAPRQKEATFISVVEPHGVYDAAAEFTAGSESQIKQVSFVESNGAQLIRIDCKCGKSLFIGVSNNPDPKAKHSVRYSGRDWVWSGFASVMKD